MSDADALKAEIKKLSAQATKAKMDLHDLSEELPIGADRIMEVATAARDAYANLTEARARLKTLENA